MKLLLKINILVLVIFTVSCKTTTLQEIEAQNHIYKFTTEQNLLDKAYSEKIEAFYNSGKEGFFDGAEDIKIYYKIFLQKKAEKGAIVISSGRTEAAVKYKELIFDLYHNGYSIYINDHRGQGLSGRMVEEHDMGYIDNFQYYIDDLKQFYNQFVTKGNHNHIYLLGHSMGGAIGITYLEQFPKDFEKASFSSPMLGLPAPSCGAVKILKGKKPEFAMGQTVYMDDSVKFEDNHLTYSKIRYQRMLDAFNQTIEARLGGASYHWVARSCQQFKYIFNHIENIATPLLLFSAEDESIVATSAHDKFIAKLQSLNKYAKGYKINASMHELFIERDKARINVLTKILNFYSNPNKTLNVVNKTQAQIIYKTKNDYSQNIPIQMNKEKTKITGFPAPSDIVINGELQTPLKLDNDFWYDRRGISANTVFLKITYKEYSKLKKAPTSQEMMQMIIDKNPITEMYSCPDLKPRSDIETINQLIKSNFSNCKKISK